MRDHSLMNPAHLDAQINYLEKFLVPQRAERTAELQSRISAAFKHFHVSNYSDKTLVLNEQQIHEVLTALAGCEVDLGYTAATDEHYLKAYKTLQKDWRYRIGSKLKFLAPK